MTAAAETEHSEDGQADAGQAEGGASNRLTVLARLQDADTRLGQIDHRVEHLPQRATRAELAAELGTLAAQAKGLDAQVHELEREQRRHEDEVARIEAKRATNSERLYESHVTSPKEAEALSAEAAALGRQQSEVEDQILELMEQLEPLYAAQSELADATSAAQVRLDVTEAAIAEAETQAAAERDETTAERQGLVDSADPGLVMLYEQRKAAARGAPAVGRLEGATCGACHLSVPLVDLEQIRALNPDEPTDCPQCGVLLVR